MRRIFDEACDRHGVTPTIAFEGTGVPTLRGLVGARLGVSVLPHQPHHSPTSSRSQSTISNWPDR
ncbi:LysR substrate-binding domain-containing protein [Mycobacterium riyadhense]|uniref:LysR substrate-binding domain-containing protein n=1 Tax=Mycobacterium riyadhense TaxID=486698 RepID=UPI002095AFDA|nr:LysR substrate-binding domain-containing protein [Mycobacterium riyadhense]